MYFCPMVSGKANHLSFKNSYSLLCWHGHIKHQRAAAASIPYDVRFRVTATTTMKKSFQALKIEFDLPIPIAFGHDFTESYGSSFLYG